MKWTTKPLAEVADFSLGKMLDDKKNRGEPLPYLANINVRWGEFDLDNLREMRFEHGEIDRYGLKYGDIVMCEGGEPGRSAIWKELVPGMMIQKALHRIRPHECLDHRFLFYSFLHKGKIGSFAPLFTGSTIKHLPRQQLAKVEIEFPQLDVQGRIADVLSAYDDLIENNRRRMALLEEAARRLYEEWFVRLRFPGYEHSNTNGSALRRIPANWELKTLGGITSKIGSGATPRGGEASYQSEGIALIRSQNVYNDRFEDDGLAYISDAQADELANVAVEPRDMLLNITGASVARCCMVPKRHLPARVNQHVMIIRPDPSLADPYFVLAAINSDERKRQLLSYARAGGTREALTKDIVADFQIVLPSKRLLQRFGEIAGEIHQQLDVLANQNVALRNARELLLPHLMSGEIALGTRHLP